MDYRNDLEAARLRINTLEAKLDETKASLNARETELVECRNERDKLRHRAEGNAPKPGLYIVIGVAGFILGSALGFTSGLVIGPSRTTGNNTLPQAEEPASTTTDTSTDEQAKIEGQIRLPPVAPAVPPATVSGQTNDETSEVTINSLIEGNRSKIRKCFNVEIQAHPQAHGSLKVTFDIDSSGKVIQTKLTNLPHLEPWWSKGFETCVIDVYRKTTFPNTTGTKVTASGSYFFSGVDLGI